jgi:hypothetical protein
VAVRLDARKSEGDRKAETHRCFLTSSKEYTDELLCWICSKTRGLGAGRKLRTHRRKNLWADKDYKKSHLGNEWKKPFAGASHAKGIVLEKM